MVDDNKDNDSIKNDDIDDKTFEEINNALFEEISLSLNDTINEDIQKENSGKSSDNDKSNDRVLTEDELFNDISMSLARQVNQEYDYKPENNMTKKKKKKKNKKTNYVLLSIFGALIIFIALIIFTDLKYDLSGAIARAFLANFADREAQYTETLRTPDVEDELKKNFEKYFDSVYRVNGKYIFGLGFSNDESAQPTPTPLIIDKVTGEARHEDTVINILLLGEEAIGLNGGRGNTDTIIILTLDTVTHEAKMTSMMRDILIALPNSTKYDRINTVYRRDGISAVYQAFEENFDIALDGCILINFEDFVSIIDALGGVVIELTSEEAIYLQTTNYIADEQYRNVVSGPNTFNGVQALGYCRIRKVPTANGLYADFGRIYRQKSVINALIDQHDLLSLDFTTIMSVVSKCGDCFYTDMTSEQISNYIKLFVENGITEIISNRIPVADTYSDTFYEGKDVISINFVKNIKALHEFIFGDYKE